MLCTMGCQLLECLTSCFHAVYEAVLSCYRVPHKLSPESYNISITISLAKHGYMYSKSLQISPYLSLLNWLNMWWGIKIRKYLASIQQYSLYSSSQLFVYIWNCYVIDKLLWKRCFANYFKFINIYLLFLGVYAFSKNSADDSRFKSFKEDI